MISTNVQSQETHRGPEDSALIPHLLELMRSKEASYDETIAYVLSLASAWSYSDPRTLQEVMNSVGFKCRCHNITLNNDAAFVRTSASLIQSDDGSVVILCFRGTEPTNIINWMTNASAHAAQFHTWGHVHGGFYRSLLPVWPYIECRLNNAIQKYWVTDRPDTPADARVTMGSAACPSPSQRVDSDAAMQSLYITGHSLGGAQAALAAAIIMHGSDGKTGDIARRLRGIYTFGQPSVGNMVFKNKCEKSFGHMLFRHEYKNDLVPRLPPLTTGSFYHFGEVFRAGDNGWVSSSQPVRQAWTALFSFGIGAVAWATQQLPVLSWIRLPFSWDDHRPLNYVSASQRYNRSEFG